jgi:hypothetical protein
MVRSVALAPVEHRVYFPHVRFVIHDATLYLDPSVGFEWHLLRANDQLCRYAVLLQEARRRCRSLEAQRLFRIPDTSDIDRETECFDEVGAMRLSTDRKAPYFAMESFETAVGKAEIENDQP